MKNLTLAAILCCFYQVFSLDICLNNCRDIANPVFCNVMMLSRGCAGGMNRILCPLTCNICKKCKSNKPVAAADGTTLLSESADCEIETCTDLAPPNQCDIIKNRMRNGCSVYPNSCRRSCGQCKPCPIPEPKKSCILDCRDNDDSCTAWKSQGFCKESSKYYTYTSQKCPMSCSICKACPTPKPINTALPPTPQTCSKDCADFSEFCEHWKEKGFCNQIKKFPYLLEVCAMTCGACKLCPTEAPTPPPPCSKECKDDNDDCEDWKEAGYCNNEIYLPAIRTICRKSCGNCTACPEEDRSTALPPTREEFEAAKRNETVYL